MGRSTTRAHGIELWSWVTDTAEDVGSIRDVLRFVVTPGRMVDHPPARNLAEWDRMCAERPVVGIGGLDAHQFGRRIAGRWPVRLMGYPRSFRHLRTHVLLDDPFTGEGARDRDAVYAALRAGRCYLAIDSLAPARGFAFWADGRAHVPMGAEAAGGDGHELRARVPRPARVRLLRDGAPVAEAEGTALDHRAREPGIYRVEATLPAHGRERTWILSNPIYLRG